MDISLMPGGMIAERYRLERPLGAGGAATVWAASDTALGRRVAVKLLTGTMGGAEGGERLRREARALASLAHPHIVTVFDYLEATGATGLLQPVLVTELLDGASLDERLARGPLPVEGALTVCGQVADALAAAHRAGIVHRDVKPGNVMLTGEGAKLLDFGIARGQEDTSLTGPLVVGTPVCMAPEQLAGHGAGPASDVYALGCLLYWCVTGRPPFPFTELTELAGAHFHSAPPALPELAGLSPRIHELYAATMAKDPAARPSAAELSQALYRSPVQVAAPPPHHTTRLLAPQEQPAPQRPRTSSARMLAIGFGVAALGLAVALAVVLSSNSSQPRAAATTGPTVSATTTAPSAATTQATPTLPDPSSDPTGYLAALATQVRSWTGQPGVDANTAADLANKLADAQNAAVSAQNSGSNKQWRDVRQKVDDAITQVSDASDSGNLPAANAQQLTTELQQLNSSLPGGGGGGGGGGQ